MAHMLITSGPTREYLDPIRYLTNASSGRMGRALARAAIDLGHEVTVVTGPVNLHYPKEAEVIGVESTRDMLSACCVAFESCDGLIAAAAPCDYGPVRPAKSKIAKTGQPLVLKLVEMPDVVATLAEQKKPHQWLVGFALDTDDPRLRALAKLQRKNCDLIVVNGPEAIDSPVNHVEVFDRKGELAGDFWGSKDEVAYEILEVIEARLLSRKGRRRAAPRQRRRPSGR